MQQKKTTQNQQYHRKIRSCFPFENGKSAPNEKYEKEKKMTEKKKIERTTFKIGMFAESLRESYESMVVGFAHFDGIYWEFALNISPNTYTHTLAHIRAFVPFSFNALFGPLIKANEPINESARINDAFDA